MKIIALVLIVVSCISQIHAAEAVVKEKMSMELMAPMQTTNDSIIAPNVFTPNNDGLNDLFEVTSKDGNKVSLKIYTRAGVLIFSIEAKTCQWNGRTLSGEEMANGVYYYTAEVVSSSPKVSKGGFLHLYR